MKKVVLMTALLVMMMVAPAVSAKEPRARMRKTPEEIEARKAAIRSKKAAKHKAMMKEESAERKKAIERKKAAKQKAVERKKAAKQKKNDQKAARDAKEAEMAQARAQRVEQHHARIKNRFHLYSQRFEVIMGKMQTRLDKMAEQGIDTTDLSAQLDQVGASIYQAESLGQEALDAIAAVGTAESVEEAEALKAEAKTAVESTRLAYRNVKDILRDLLRMMKDAKEAKNTVQ